MTHIRTAPAVLAVVFLAGLATLASPAQAIFIETPLRLGSDRSECEVGDTLTFTIGPSPDNASQEEQWAGRTVQARYSYDKTEGEDTHHGDEPASTQGYTEGMIQEVTLDDQARGAFTWRVPTEVDAKNVNVFLGVEGSDERLAFAYIAVGNATPMMHVMGGPAPAGGGSGVVASHGDDPARDTLGLGFPGLLAALGAGLAGVARRR